MVSVPLNSDLSAEMETLPGYTYKPKNDTGVEDWNPLTNGAFLVIVLAASYLIAVVHPPRIVESAFKRLTQLYTKHPTAFTLLYVIVNTIQILTCIWIVAQIIKHDGINKSMFHCQRDEILASTEPHHMLSVCWVYHLLNILAILDTVHLKIRGRKPIFLHVYHHTVAILWSWLVFKIYPGGHNMVFVLGIAATHAVMYSYYLATLVGVNMYRSLFWKLITLLEIGWIMIGLMYMGFLYFNGCPYPWSLQVFSVTISCILLLSFLVVFSNALRREYHSKGFDGPKRKKSH